MQSHLIDDFILCHISHAVSSQSATRGRFFLCLVCRHFTLPCCSTLATWLIECSWVQSPSLVNILHYWFFFNREITCISINYTHCQISSWSWIKSMWGRSDHTIMFMYYNNVILSVELDVTSFHTLSSVLHRVVMHYHHSGAVGVCLCLQNRESLLETALAWSGWSLVADLIWTIPNNNYCSNKDIWI